MRVMRPRYLPVMAREKNGEAGEQKARRDRRKWTVEKGREPEEGKEELSREQTRRKQSGQKN